MLQAAQILTWIAMLTYVWTVITGITMIATTPAHKKDFSAWEIWDGIKITCWIPLVLISQGQKRARQLMKLHHMKRDPLNYTGTWLTTAGGLIFSGLMLLWLTTLDWQPMGYRVMILWAIAHILCNGGKSIFHVKATMNNLEEEAKECITAQNISQAV